MMFCAIFSICVALWYALTHQKGRWQDHYRVGSRPAWLPTSYPDSRFVDWSSAGPILWAAEIEESVRLVAAVATLRAEIVLALGQAFEAALCDVPLSAQAGALVFYGRMLLGCPLSAAEALEKSFMLHYEEGFAVDPRAYAASQADLYRDLFEFSLPPACRPFCEAAPDRLAVFVKPLSTSRPEPRPWMATTAGVVHRKTE